MSDLAATSPALDLSRLPAPKVVEELSFAQLVAARLEDLQARMPGAFDALVESDPALKLAEAEAYREFLTRGRINDAARSVMLPHAGGADLDNLAAFYGLERLVIMPATETESALLEPDADLRRRILLAPDSLAAAGMVGGGYIATALRVAPSLKDVAAIKRGGGQVDIVLLGRTGDGSVASDVVDAVHRTFAAEDGAQLTDIVTVRSATIVPYSVAITLQVRPGPDPQVVRAAAEASARAYAVDRHRVGAIVYARMMSAAAAVGGVENALIDIGDVDPGVGGAAFLDQFSVTIQVLP